MVEPLAPPPGSQAIDKVDLWLAVLLSVVTYISLIVSRVVGGWSGIGSEWVGRTGWGLSWPLEGRASELGRIGHRTIARAQVAAGSGQGQAHARAWHRHPTHSERTPPPPRDLRLRFLWIRAPALEGSGPLAARRHRAVACARARRSVRRHSPSRRPSLCLSPACTGRGSAGEQSQRPSSMGMGRWRSLRSAGASAANRASVAAPVVRNVRRLAASRPSHTQSMRTWWQEPDH